MVGNDEVRCRIDTKTVSGWDYGCSAVFGDYCRAFVSSVGDQFFSAIDFRFLFPIVENDRRFGLGHETALRSGADPSAALRASCVRLYTNRLRFDHRAKAEGYQLDLSVGMYIAVAAFMFLFEVAHKIFVER